MSRIRSKDTGPEKKVRSALFKMGYRFRLHQKTLPGKPDIVLPKYKKVIFVHGCFWHRHTGCQNCTTPKSRQSFWNKKFNANIARFSKVKKALCESGWGVEVIWECETKQENTLRNRLSDIEFSQLAKG